MHNCISLVIWQFTINMNLKRNIYYVRIIINIIYCINTIYYIIHYHCSIFITWDIARHTTCIIMQCTVGANEWKGLKSIGYQGKLQSNSFYLKFKFHCSSQYRQEIGQYRDSGFVVVLDQRFYFQVFQFPIFLYATFKMSFIFPGSNYGNGETYHWPADPPMTMVKEPDVIAPWAYLDWLSDPTFDHWLFLYCAMMDVLELVDESYVNPPMM